MNFYELIYDYRGEKYNRMVVRADSIITLRYMIIDMIKDGCTNVRQRFMCSIPE